MNWRTGLLRIWAVLSLLWIVAYTWVSNPIQEIRDASAPARVYVGNASFDMPDGTSPQVVRKWLLQYEHSDDAKRNLLTVSGLSMDKAIDYAVATYKPHSIWQSVSLALASIFWKVILPPACGFAGVFVLMWIVRGFQARPDSN
jgi:hypothetical protein